MCFYEEEKKILFEVKLNNDKYIIIDKGKNVGEFYMENNGIYFYCADEQKKYSLILQEEESGAETTFNVLCFFLLGWYDSSPKSDVFNIYDEINQKNIGRYFSQMDNLELNINGEINSNLRGIFATIVLLSTKK